MSTTITRAALLALVLTAPAWAQPPSDDEAPVTEPVAEQSSEPAADQTSEPSAEPISEPPAAPTPQDLATLPVDAQPPPPPEADEPARLDDVVVTATKREANTRDLPSSVSALPGEDLERLGYQGQEDFLKLIPGVTFMNDAINTNRITIRGIGADLNTSNTTGVFIGDVPFEEPTLPRVTLDPNPFDLARIEVLKGPQGTLFGGSALNGAVRYVPQEPLLGTWETKGFAQVEHVFEGTMAPAFGAATNIPIGDAFSVRLVALKRESPGWVDNFQRGVDNVNSSSSQGGRVLGLWQPDERWKVSGMAVLHDSHLDDCALTDNHEGRLNRNNSPQASPVDTKYDLETLGIQYAFDTFDVHSQTSRTKKSFDAFVDASRIGNQNDRPQPSVSITDVNRSKSLMQELRVASNAGFDSSWTWLAGAFYRRVHITDKNDVLGSDQPLPTEQYQAIAGFIPGSGGIVTEDNRLSVGRGYANPIDVTEEALFGEVTKSFWERLEVTVGARLFRNESYSKTYFSGVLTRTPQNTTGVTESVKEGTLVERDINPKLALKYEVSDHASVYAAAAKGYRFGGAQVLVGTTTSTAPDYYKSDTLWSYEVGARTQWLDRTLIADMTIFYLDWTDPQLQQADNSGLGAFFDNVGGAVSHGVELSTRYLTPLPGLALSFVGSYANTVTSKAFRTASGSIAPAGTRWPLAAAWQSSTTVAYQTALFGSWDTGASLVYSTISSAPNTLQYLDTVFGFKTLDASLNVGNSSMPWQPRLSLNLANATDERGLLSGVNNPAFGADHNYIRPRTLVARLGFSF